MGGATGLRAIPAIARPVLHDPSPAWKRCVGEDHGSLVGDCVGDQPLPRGLHGMRITARGDPVGVRDFTGMMEQIADDVADLATTFDAHDAVARRLPRSRNHCNTRRHLLLTIDQCEQAKALERSEMDGQCGVGPFAVGVPFPVRASYEVPGLWTASNATAIAHGRHTGEVIVMGMGD